MIPENEICDAIKVELWQAVDEHGPIHGLHEAHSIMLEELEEFWEEVKKKQSVRHQADWIKELLQLGAMCVRTIQDCTQSDSLELAMRKYE
jgi:hypothetical protein